MCDQGLRNVTTPLSSREPFQSSTSLTDRLTDSFNRHVSNVPQSRGWERKIADGPPCVVLASPGFITQGPSRELLELWAPDSRNGVIITGYSIEGTMARVSTLCSLWRGRSYSMPCLVLYVHQENRKRPIFHPKPNHQSRPSCLVISYAMRPQQAFIMMKGGSLYSIPLLGYSKRTRRDYLHQRAHNTAQDIGRRNLVQCTCRLFTELRVHRGGTR